MLAERDLKQLKKLLDKKDQKWLRKIKEDNLMTLNKYFGDYDGTKKHYDYGDFDDKFDKKFDKKPDKSYCKKMMEYCKKKFKQCDGKDADKCREYYKEKYKKFKEMYEKCNYDYDHKYDYDHYYDKDCYHTYRCLMKLLKKFCSKHLDKY